MAGGRPLPVVLGLHCHTIAEVSPCAIGELTTIAEELRAFARVRQVFSGGYDSVLSIHFDFSSAQELVPILRALSSQVFAKHPEVTTLILIGRSDDPPLLFELRLDRDDPVDWRAAEGMPIKLVFPQAIINEAHIN